MSRFSPPTTPAGSGAYARPPPPPGGFHPPPPGGFHPPPPGQGQQQPLNQGMSNLSIGSQQQIRPAMFNPPAPQGPPGPQVGFAPPTPVGSFPSQPPPPPGGVPLPPMAPRLPTMFMPPALSSSGAPPPTLTQPPPPNQPASVTQHGQLNPTTSNSSFFMPAPTPGQMQRVTAPPAPSGITPGMPNQMESVDLSITIPPSMFRFTCGAIPGTPSLLSQAKVPVGGLVRPLAPIADEDEPVETVQPGNAGIIRCKKCRTYINGFVTWMENGRRWRCNICAQVNDCPSTYFCHLDEKGQRRDKDERPELSKGVVEFLAPAEYMVRPPQEPTYFFVIDVSAMSVRSGMLSSAANAIRRSLDDLPGGGRTKIGFITYDSSVHYYNLSSDLKGPQMMVVSDLNELFVPLPDNLLVNAKESRHVIEAFLDSLPDMFSKNPVVSASCLGPALKAAFTVTKQIGGKMCVFQSIMPNLGDGALRPRENQAIMGTPNEIKVLRPDIPWYKDTAIEFSRQQISVDMFLFPYQYMDVSALSELPKYTSGALYSYVGFHPEKDGPRFESELHKRLTQTTAFEAVMRIRCTKGMRITNFYGNFFIRGTDLLALPNCTSDSVFAFDLVHDEQNMPSSVVTIQAALLYTSSDGQRRIRVMTQAFPLTNSMPEFIASVDAEATCCLMSKQALDLSMKTTIDNARMRLQQTCVEVIRASKGGRSVSGYSVPPPGAPGGGVADGGDADIPENLELLPVYTLAMMKNVAFRGGTDVHPDERICAQFALNSMWVDQCRDYIYPRMFSIHDMSRAVGLPFEGNLDDDDVQVAGRKNILLPQVVNLTCERLRPDGIFLLDNGMQMNLWIGHSANSNTLNSLLGISSLDNVDVHQLTVNLNGDDFANRFGSVVFALREMEGEQFLISPKIEIVREGDIHLEARFFWSLIEDRASFQGGTYNYAEFMDFIKNPQSVGGPQSSSLNPVRTGAPPARGPPPPGPPGQPQNYGSASSFQQGQPPPGNYGPPPPGQPNVPHNQHGPIINGPPSQGNQTSGFMPPPHSAPPGVPSYGQPPPPANVGIPPTSSSSFQGPPPPPVGNRGGPPSLHGGYNVPPPFGNQGVPPQNKPGEHPSQASYGAPPQGQLGMPPTAPSGNTPPSRLSENNQVTSQGPPGNIRMPPPPGPPGSFQSSLPGSVGNRGGPQIQGGRLPPPPGGGTPGVPPPPGRAQGGLPPPPKMGAPRPPPPPPQYS